VFFLCLQDVFVLSVYFKNVELKKITIKLNLVELFWFFFFVFGFCRSRSHHIFFWTQNYFWWMWRGGVINNSIWRIFGDLGFSIAGLEYLVIVSNSSSLHAFNFVEYFLLRLFGV
jgi:hypothetical protein